MMSPMGADLPTHFLKCYSRNLPLTARFDSPIENKQPLWPAQGTMGLIITSKFQLLKRPKNY